MDKWEYSKQLYIKGNCLRFWRRVRKFLPGDCVSANFPREPDGAQNIGCCKGRKLVSELRCALNRNLTFNILPVKTQVIIFVHLSKSYEKVFIPTHYRALFF